MQCAKSYLHQHCTDQFTVAAGCRPKPQARHLPRARPTKRTSLCQFLRLALPILARVSRRGPLQLKQRLLPRSRHTALTWEASCPASRLILQAPNPTSWGLDWLPCRSFGMRSRNTSRRGLLSLKQSWQDWTRRIVPQAFRADLRAFPSSRVNVSCASPFMPSLCT